jgi:DNA-binding NtrC family response regulator
VAPSHACLVLDDSPGTARALQRVLADWRCTPGSAASPGASAEGSELVFVALLETEAATQQLLRDLRAGIPDAPVILLGADASGYAAAIRLGAFDYLRKPLEPDAVLLAVQRALEFRLLDLARQQLEQAVAALRRRAEEADARGVSAAAPCQALQCVLRERLSLRELQDRYVDAILALTGGNKVRAAEILGIDRRTLYRRGERDR